MRGLTLAEAVLTALMVCVVVLVLASLAPVSWVTLQRGEAWLVGDALAQDIITQAECAAFHSLVEGPARDLPSARVGAVEYHLSLQISRVAGCEPTLLKAARVLVWYEERGARREIVHVRWIHGLSR